MERDSTRTSDTLNRPEGNDLKSNYNKHDIAQAYVKQHLRDLDLDVEDWGIDMRHDNDELVFDDRMDLRVFADESDSSANPSGLSNPDKRGGTRDSIVAITEIKAKTNEDWFGIINLRHYEHYLDIRNEYNCPVCIYMALVDDDSNEDTSFDSDSGYIERDAFIPLDAYDGDPVDAPQVSRTFTAPDGNQVVKLDEDSYVGWNQFVFDLGKSTEVRSSLRRRLRSSVMDERESVAQCPECGENGHEVWVLGHWHCPDCDLTYTDSGDTNIQQI